MDHTLLQKQPLGTNQKRECFLDLLRILACFLVLVNHTAGMFFLERSPEETAWFLSVIYFFCAKPAVPIFFMISGYLLLGRQDSWSIAWKRIFRILVVLIFSAAAYAVFHGLTLEPRLTPEEMLHTFLRFYYIPPSNALWYLYAYLGILIMMPFLQKMEKTMTKTDYRVLFCLSAVFTGTIPMLYHFHNSILITGEFALPLMSNTIAMLFAGRYFSRFGVKKTWLGFLIAAAVLIASVLLSTALTYREYYIYLGIEYLYFDNREFLPNMLATLSLFYLATFVTLPEKLEKAVTYVGSCTFGIYLLGDMVLDSSMPFYALLQDTIHPLIAMVLYEIFIFAVCFVVIALVRKIPGMKKWI